jgi:hypothetical protein
MDPDTFLEQEDVHQLVQALNTFALEISEAEDRKDLLINAGIRFAFCSKLIFGANAYLFANQLVAYFKAYQISREPPPYHPMINLLEYLLRTYELSDVDRNLFKKLVKQGLENFKALSARNAVGRIESPPGIARGTGVLVDRQHLLTCNHVIERILENGLEQAWVRFGYKVGRYGTEEGEIFELDIKSITANSTRSDHVLDYALISIHGRPEQQPAFLIPKIPNTSQNFRLIHHPQGQPLQISDAGQILQATSESIEHNIKANYGSSGAPIFDPNWNVVAIHRGIPSSSRSATLSLTEAIPLFSIWNDIEPHLHLVAAK